MNKIFIMPYFGELPEWYDKFELPKGYEILLDTDLNGFRTRVKEKLGIDYPGLPGTGKVFDYRCALGVLYKDEIKGYDYFGHCDFDMVFGDVDKWFPDEELAQLDIWSNHGTYICGPWTMYKNTERVCNLFKEFPDWKEKMIYPEVNGWVENEYSRLVEQSGLKYRYSFEQGDPYHPPFNLVKKDGKLYQDGIEIPMLHFRRSKIWPL